MVIKLVFICRTPGSPGVLAEFGSGAGTAEVLAGKIHVFPEFSGIAPAAMLDLMALHDLIAGGPAGPTAGPRLATRNISDAVNLPPLRLQE